MNRRDVYFDVRGRGISLADLDDEELDLVGTLQRRADSHRDWTDFDNFWVNEVSSFYDARGLSRRESRRTAVYRIAQDLSGRLAIAAGAARAPDYRDELEEIIRTRFATRREFCAATGLSEDMLSHVLARRKHMSMETLVRALDRIGYDLRVVPRADGCDRPNDPVEAEACVLAH